VLPHGVGPQHPQRKRAATPHVLWPRLRVVPCTARVVAGSAAHAALMMVLIIRAPPACCAGNDIGALSYAQCIQGQNLSEIAVGTDGWQMVAGGGHEK